MPEYNEQKSAVSIQPGLYLILPEDPVDATKGPGGIPIPIPMPIPSYATAPEQDGNPILLELATNGFSRQIWQVKVVDPGMGVYNINRADLVWSPPEFPPTFGINGEPENQKPVDCLEGEENNLHQWKIVHRPPQQAWLQQSMFEIVPFTGDFQEPKYFVNDETVRTQGEPVKESAQPGMVLSRIDSGIRTQTWYFQRFTRS